MINALLAAALLAGAAIPASAQRLPTTVVPVHYELAIDPDLAAATFTGEETITVTLKAPSAAIVLNAAEIAFKSAQITAGGRTQTAQVKLDAPSDQAILTVPAPVPAGQATIRISYSGILNNDLRGLYLSKANNRRYAVTQLEATDARRMFPSFDEPALKATFTLAAVVDAADHAISNGAVVSDTPGPRAGTHTVKFATTPKMSSYLLALAVGDFVCNEGAADGIPIRICSTPDKKALTGFALESTEQIIKYYNRYYSIKYPFKKLDIVAVPDFAAGAMENTAAIFYRETLLLADANASVDTRREIAVVLAHEIAHQWFGDLVTMNWWDDIWLNEGFATWMETRPVKQWKPEWMMEMGETARNQKAMNLDALPSTRPIRTRASTPNEINELFDPIAYEKGGAVLRMIESWVGEQAFQKAVNAYLEKFKYGNARAEDFWRTVATSTGFPVDRVMPTLVDQPGLPLVNVATSCEGGRSTITFSQSRYVLGASAAPPADSPLWRLPVCYRSDSGAASCEMLDQAREVVTRNGCPAWIMPNAGGRGYYRASMDPAALAALSANITKLTGPERMTLLADEWALVRAGARDVNEFLNLSAAFGSEENEQVVEVLAGALRAIDRQMTTDATRPGFRAWVIKLLGPAAVKLGSESARGASTDDNTTSLRAALLQQLGDARDPGAMAEARRLVEQELNTPKSVDPTLLNVAVYLAAASGDASLYERYLARATPAVDPEERYRFLFGLTSFADPALIRRTVEYALGPEVRTQDTTSLLSALLGNGAARPIVWDMLRQRWDEVQKKTGDFGGNTGIVSALSSFCDASRATEIKEFFASHPVPDAARTLAQTLERVNACASLSAAQSPKLAAWLETKGGAPKP